MKYNDRFHGLNGYDMSLYYKRVYGLIQIKLDLSYYDLLTPIVLC